EHLKSALLQKMFADKSGYPAVRFEGFSNEWEHCKLGNVADITTGSRNHQDSVTDGKYPFFVRSDKVERLNEYDFDTKAILVPGDGRIGEIFHYYNGKFALHQRVYKVDNFNGINELFLLGLFKYSFKEHALRLNAQGTVPSLRLPMFTNWSISVPMITEQERIGVFFQKLDRTISLYDHKLELLKKVKRSMLQAMFI
ncbi:restriction endonuclease subunit S, partial [Lactobacillus delbrueckii]